MSTSATKARCTLYCDETGNTGKNFADRSQPIFVEGGWLVRNAERDTLIQAMVALEKAAGYDQTEVKGSRLLGSAKGREFLRHVAETIGPRAVPYFYLVEKRYAICAKLVESLFDPAYNPQVTAAETWNPDERQNYAQRFYNGPDDLIYAFGAAYRDKDPAAVRANAESWRTYFAASGLTPIAQRVAAVLPKLEEEMLIEFGAFTAARGQDTLNMPIWVMLFQDMEHNFPEPCRVIHDRIAEFEQCFRDTYDLFRKGGPRGMQLKDGRPMSFGLRQVVSLEFRDSQNEPLIRAADCLMASTRAFAWRAFNDESIDPNLVRGAYPTVGALMCWVLSHMHPSVGFFPQIGTVMASEQFAAKLFKKAVDTMSPDKLKRERR